MPYNDELSKEDKQFLLGLLGTVISIPMALFVSYAKLNPGWAFILGIAYAAIWRVTDNKSKGKGV